MSVAVPSPRILHAIAHRVFGGRTCTVPDFDNVLTLARGDDVASSANNKEVVASAIPTKLVHGPVGVGVARHGTDKVTGVNHWKFPYSS